VERDSAAFRSLVAKVMNLGALEIEDGWIEDGDVQVFKFVTKPVRGCFRAAASIVGSEAYPSLCGVSVRHLQHDSSPLRPIVGAVTNRVELLGSNSGCVLRAGHRQVRAEEVSALHWRRPPMCVWRTAMRPFC